MTSLTEAMTSLTRSDAALATHVVTEAATRAASTISIIEALLQTLALSRLLGLAWTLGVIDIGSACKHCHTHTHTHGRGQ